MWARCVRPRRRHPIHLHEPQTRPSRTRPNTDYNVGMIEPLLRTKLYIPLPRPLTILRPRLVQRLTEGLPRKLTLISAPAGFGKSTLAGDWVARCGRPVAWLSLDEGDNDPARFLAYLVAALQTVNAEIGRELLGLLQRAQPPLPSPESLLTELLNSISALPESFVLVLDDYHVIDSKPVDQALAFLVEHLPPQLHLVIATREDPPLPLARLRARGQLTEVRAADLRFSPVEAADFLNRAMGLNLSDDEVEALEARTEGWIAGLQLAALSMQGRADTTGFIQAFTGSHRFVLDYLAGEVLERQPEEVRNFLLQTAVLDRLCGPLCDAVMCREGSRALLEQMERGNLFVVPLDDQRQWHRYHHLFADVLLARLREAHPAQVSGLHRRAGTWFEQNGFPAEAIRHVVAAEDFDRAAGLIELAWSTMDLSYQSATWLGWVRALPDAVVRARPVLSVGYGWALLEVGELEASEARLQDAERLLAMPSDERVVVDTSQFRSLAASIATARAYRSLALGDVPATVQYARQALERTPTDDHVRQTQAVSLLGLAQYASGELPAAERSLAALHTHLKQSGDTVTLMGITFLLADIRVTLGRLHDAESIYQQTLRLAAAQGEPMPLGTADLYRGLGELSIERGDLDAAAQQLLTGRKLGEQAATTDWQHRLHVSQALLKEAEGDPEGALALLDEAARVQIRGPLPDVRPVAALRVRLWIRQGRLAEVPGWVRAQGPATDDAMSFLREFEQITLARVLIAEANGDRKAATLNEATLLLERLLHAAEAGGRLGSALQILLLQALAYHAQDDYARALTALARALALAEPEGYLRSFVDESEAMRLLLAEFSQNRSHPSCGYANKLLAAFAQPVTAPTPVKVRRANLPDPLSEREIEVLKLLQSELSGPEIAQRLIISLNTFRTHTRNIFDKLEVNNRRAAIRRAEELELL